MGGGIWLSFEKNAETSTDNCHTLKYNCKETNTALPNEHAIMVWRTKSRIIEHCMRPVNV